ncbi:MAG: hypothetical protein KDA85_16270, partial [Planctomycetaceae bacterium]|nr:hypothetical protein [Planctomycetaceae bacterium]
MSDSRHLYGMLLQYEGYAVTVQTYGLGRYFGLLHAVHVDCLCMRATQQMGDPDESPWFSEIRRSQWEEAPTGSAETLIPLGQIISVTCDDDRFVPTSDHSASVESVTGPQSKADPLSALENALTIGRFRITPRNDGDAANSGAAEEPAAEEP